LKEGKKKNGVPRETQYVRLEGRRFIEEKGNNTETQRRGGKALIDQN